MTRLATEFWVQAYLLRLQQDNIAAYVVARGDATAGAVLIKQSTLDGTATLHQRQADLMTGRRQWMELMDGPEPEVDGVVSRQRQSDPDLWVIEVEDRAGRHLLDTPGLDD